MNDKPCSRCSRPIYESYLEEYKPSNEDVDAFYKELENKIFCLSCRYQLDLKRSEVFNNLLTVNTEGEPYQNLATALLALALIQATKEDE